MNRINPPWFASPPTRGTGARGVLALGLLAAGLGLQASSAQAVSCNRTITANVVVLDNPTVFNRLGAQNPNWITYALRRDVVDAATGRPESQGGTLGPGLVALRPDKRPRTLVLKKTKKKKSEKLKKRKKKK